MWEEGVIEWYQSMVHPQNGWVMCWSCIHVSCICVSCVVRPYSCCICMVWVMVAMRSPWEVDGVVVECVVMSVWLIMHVSIHMWSCVQ